MLFIKTVGKTRFSPIAWIHKRAKVTVTKLEPSPNALVKRPTPILFVRTVFDREVSNISNWQTKLSKLGYSSVDAAIDIQPNYPISSYYQELSQVTTDLSFFPPLMISQGMLAWRIAEKYVSNKPLSGLVMMDHHEQDTKVDLTGYPHHEFEPHFPIYVLSRHSPPEFLEGWVDYDQPQDEVEQVLAWMDDIGM